MPVVNNRGINDRGKERERERERECKTIKWLGIRRGGYRFWIIKIENSGRRSRIVFILENSFAKFK